MIKKKLCILGAGGAAKDAYTILLALGLKEELDCFLESDEIWVDKRIQDTAVRPFSYFNFKKHRLIIAFGDSVARKEMAGKLPQGTEFFSLIHPEAIISPLVQIGAGCIIGAGSILTYDVVIGDHAHINIATTITHDCRIGDFFTSAPAVNISGNCTIGNCVFIGTNASVREKTIISDNIIIGMGSIVLNDLIESGVYAGVPARRLI